MDNAQEFYVYNPVKQNKGIGRRTGKPVYKKRNIYNGVDNFDDYLTDSDDEASINVTNHLQSAAEGAESSQILKDVLSSGKSGATQTRDLSLREDVAAKSIQQLPPEKFDNVRIFNPLTLGSRFGRRTGKDVLSGKVLAEGLEDFSAFLSDNTDISVSMQATPTQSAPEQLSPSTSAKKSGGILSAKKSRDRTQVLVNTDSRMRTHVEKPSFSAASSEQQCSQEVLELAFEEQGISHPQVPECINTAVEVEHVLEDTSSSDARSKRLQCIDKKSTNVNSLQRLALENPSSRASLNTSQVKNSLHDDGQEWMSLSLSKASQTLPEKEHVNTPKVKTCHNDDERAQLGLSMSKATQTGSEKENLMPESDKQVGRLDKTEEVQTTYRDSEGSNNPGKKEAADIYQHTSAEESIKTISDVQRVVPVQQSQPSAVKQVQHLDSSKGHKTNPGISLLLQSADVEAQESTGVSGEPESLIASQATSSGQKNPSIDADGFHIPRVSDIGQQSHSERSLQTTEFTGQLGGSRHMTKSSAALNFGGDQAGSVSRSEQAVGGQFFGIKKRLSYSYALIEGEQLSVECRQNVETVRLIKAVPREKKSIGSFLGQHEKVNTDQQSTVSETGTFVTLAPRRISQLTSDVELLNALNTSTDNPDDFCIVEEESIVCNSSAVANKHPNVNSKADKKQPRHIRNNKSSSAKQEKMGIRKQQTDFRTDSQKGNNYLQANQDSLLEENLVTNLLKKRKSIKSAGAILDGPDTSLEARTLISLTSQQVTDGTDHRRKRVQGDQKLSKRKGKHFIEDEASPPKQIKCNGELDTDTEVQEKDINSEVLNNTKLLKLRAKIISKIKRNKKDGSLYVKVVKSPPKQIKCNEELDTDTEVQEKDIDSEVLYNTKLLKLRPTKISKIKHNKKDGSLDVQVVKSPPKQIKCNEELDTDTEVQEKDIDSEVLYNTKLLKLRPTKISKIKHNKKDGSLDVQVVKSPPKQIKCNEELDTDTEVQEKDIDSEVLNNTKLLKLRPTKISKIKHNKKDGSSDVQVVKQLKENNNVSNTTEKRSNLSHKVDDRKGKKVSQKLSVPDKPGIETSLQAALEEANVVGYLNTNQNNPSTIYNEGSKTVQGKFGKSSKQNKRKVLSKDLKQLQDTKLPKLKRSQRNRSKVLGSECNSDNNSSDLLQQESVTIQNPTADTVAVSNNSPVLTNSRRYSIRSGQAAKSGQNSSAKQSEQHFSVTQSAQHPSVTQSEQHSSVTQSEQYMEPSGSQTATVGKITKQKLKGSRRTKTGRGKQNKTSGRKTKARNIQENRKLSRLATNFNLGAIYENITEEESNISDTTAHSIVEVNVPENNPNVDEDVPRSRKEKVKNVKNTTLEKTCTENYTDSQAISYTQGCDVNHDKHPSAEKNADSRKSVDVSVPIELLGNKKRVASRKSVCGKVRRADKSLSGNKSVHSESGHEVCSPPKLQLISSLPNVTPQSGISFRQSRCHTSDLSDAGSFSPPTVPRIPTTRDEECFTPHLKEQKTPVITSCLKNADSSVRPRRKARRVRISSIIDQKIFSSVESEISDSPSVAATSLLSVNSSPVHYGETTTNNISLASKSTGITLPDLSYKIIRPETNHVEGLRRSARTRVMRLNSHRGEGIIYRRDSTGFELIVDSIQPSVGEARVKAAEERRRKMLKQRKLKAMNVPAKPAKRLSTHWKVDDIITSSTEIPVINPDNNEEVLLELIARGDSATWYGPDLTPVTGTEPVALCLHLKQQMFTTGEMNMRALAEKPSEFTEHTLIMYVICGKILLRINGVSTIVDTGDSFFIPRGTSYSIKNLRRDIAKLHFVDIDDTDKEHSFTQSYLTSITSDQTGNK